MSVDGGDGLFYRSGSGPLISMTSAPYEAEAVLQQLLARHPDLLAGGQMNPGNPRRWLLVQREYGVPGDDSAGSRWSLDHLFVDQDAVATLVEVKRSTDTRIRREVVGQMLDYAANGIRYWPADKLRSGFEEIQRQLGSDPERAIRELCRDESMSIERYFEQVVDNLRAGRVRLVFLADHIPDELQRVVEFLNEQMSPAEVFAVGVKQYVAEGGDEQVLVPTLYGRTAAASQKSASPTLTQEDADPATQQLLDLVTLLARTSGYTVRQSSASIQVRNRNARTIVGVYIAGGAEIGLKPLFDRGDDDFAQHVVTQLQGMTSKRLTARYPTLPSADAVQHWPDLERLLVELAERL